MIPRHNPAYLSPVKGCDAYHSPGKSGMLICKCTQWQVVCCFSKCSYFLTKKTFTLCLYSASATPPTTSHYLRLCSVRSLQLNRTMEAEFKGVSSQNKWDLQNADSISSQPILGINRQPPAAMPPSIGVSGNPASQQGWGNRVSH